MCALRVWVGALVQPGVSFIHMFLLLSDFFFILLALGNPHHKMFSSSLSRVIEVLNVKRVMHCIHK